LDVDISDASDRIDALIERRAAERERANWEARSWAESVERYDLRRCAAQREEWAEFYRSQIRAAESMRERAVERLGRLLDGAGTGAP
jgi:hypothetical protein